MLRSQGKGWGWLSGAAQASLPQLVKPLPGIQPNPLSGSPNPAFGLLPSGEEKIYRFLLLLFFSERKVPTRKSFNITW